MVEKSLGVAMSVRGNKLLVQGDSAAVQQAVNFIEEIRKVNRNGYMLKPEDIAYAVKSLGEGNDVALTKLFEGSIPVAAKKRFIIPNTDTQRAYI
jgi:phosphate starvation-inducible PhoH-like protein